MTRPRHRGLLCAALATGLALVSPAALAIATCTVSASAVNFGVYNPLSGAPLNSSATLTTTCTRLGPGQNHIALTMSLSAGSSGSFAARKLSSGASALQYNLYQTAAYQIVWGDGTGGSSTSSASLHVTTGQPVQQVVQTIYGQISPGQDVNPGSYLDTIVVTVNY